MPIVNIVLCTYEGGAFIDAQLQSFLDQDHDDWRLWVSDDGSTDDTRGKIAAFGRRHPNRDVRLFDGPGRGVAANFLRLLAHDDLAGSWISFADQDDVWMPHKLSRALAQLTEHSDILGRAIYASHTLQTGPDLNVIGPSRRHGRLFGFGNALVQNVLAGNTIVMPPETTDLIRETLPAALTAAVPFHDWWIYLVATGAGVPVINDVKPGLFYRQHGRNLLGSRTGNRAARFRMLKDRTYAGWIDRNIAALREVAPMLSEDNQARLEGFATWRGMSFLRRISSLHASGVYRQSWRGDMVLRALSCTGRI